MLSKFPGCRRSLPASLLLVILLPAGAYAAAPTVPNAGSILQQNQPVTPPAPSSAGTGLSIEGEGGAALPASAPFLVTSIQLSGNSHFDTATLHALVADIEGKTVTLQELAAAVARISNYYHDHGYPLARAIIPAQSIKAGAVRIEIIEARYGQIVLENASRVGSPVLQATLAPLQSGQPIAQGPLDHTLLLLSDVPGVVVVATLKPGEAVGTSDLVVGTSSTAALAGFLNLDNDGNRYTGRVRGEATASYINPFHHGDVASLTGLSSGDMNYGSASYESLLDGSGSRLGGSYSALHYILGNDLRPLDGHGIADVASLWMKHPFVRTPNVNVYGQIQYDHKRLDDEIGASDLRTDRHLDDWTASVAGDVRDGFLTGGINTWSAGATAGRVGFDNDSSELADAATSRTRGKFLLWTATFSRLQRLTAKDSLYLSLSGQETNANLDPAEKMVAGGVYTVRAYDIGALSGDSGIVGNVEFRHDLLLLLQGPLQAVAFVDAQRITINHNVWVAGPNAATLKGAGVGLSWSGARAWSAKTYIAAPFGPTPVLIGANNSLRVWAEISKGF